MPHRLLRKLAGWAASREKNVKNVAGEVSRAFEERLLVLVAQEAVQPGGGGSTGDPSLAVGSACGRRTPRHSPGPALNSVH